MTGRIIKRIGRVIVFLTAVVMLAVLLPSLDDGNLSVRAMSLKHIEEIVAQSGTFNILEIVPEAQAATIGYYIDGQEPVAGWKTTLGETATPAARIRDANALFQRLDDNGILSGTTSTPLRYTYVEGSNYYTEAYLPDDFQNWRVLPLRTPETITLTGTMTPQAGGSFRGSYDYSPLSGGGFVQNIRYFEWTDAPAESGDIYYYNPVFLPVTPASNLDTMRGFAVYQLDENGHYYADPGKLTVQDYINDGGFDISGFKFEDPSTYKYFYVDPAMTGAPGEYSYAAVPDATDEDDAPGDGFTDGASGGVSYFSRAVTSYTYSPGSGNYTFSGTGSTDYSATFNTVYYKGGFTSNNLFKQQVFGLEAERMNALAVTVTVRTAPSVTASDIDGADMIYISAGADITKDGVLTAFAEGNDVSGSAAVGIYNFAAAELPVIVDYKIVAGITSSTPAADISMIEKLCLLCLQPALTPTAETSLGALTVNWPALAYLAGDADKTLVNNNVYCFNPFNTAAPGAAASVTELVTALFNQPFSDTVVSGGFTAVLAEIKNENFLHQIAGESDRLPETVTVSTAVRHIINYKGRREMNAKTSIRVLDLEPAKVTAASWLTESKVKSWLPTPQAGETLPAVTIVHMTTGEFIGKIEDIVETYDMIYVGMSTESLNTSGTATVFNDAAMNGLVYTNVGDTYRTTLELAGIRSMDYVMLDGVKAVNGGPGTTANLFRFSGNDITASKAAEFKKFADAGYPVILGGDFLSGASVNTDKVDCRSNLYKAISQVLGTAYPNVMSEQSAAANKELVKKHLNVSKPSLNLTAAPPEYVTRTSPPLTAQTDGYYYLTYRFAISNVTDATPISTTYDCRLYIDLNADGRYSDSEELGDIEVRRAADGTLVLPETAAGGGEYYTLTAGVDYAVSRQMPEYYVGIIPWKLEVVKNNAQQIHASAQGFTRIAAGDAYQTIRVLQIMQDGTSGTKLNLASQLTVNPSGTNLQLRGDDGKYYTGIYGKLIADLDDFRVLIDVVETDDLEAKKTAGGTASSDNIFDYLNGYDMLMIGFNDCFDGIGAYSAPAIVSYIQSGKSVLFTHDTTSLTQTEPNAAHPGAYPLADAPAASKTLADTNIIWNSATSQYKSIDGAADWYGPYSGTIGLNLKQVNPTYIVFLNSDISATDENAYFNARAGTSGDYKIYNVSSISSYGDVASAQDKTVTGTTTLQSFRDSHPGASIYYVFPTSSSGWYGRYDATLFNVTMTARLTTFADGVRHVRPPLTWQAANGYTTSTRNIGGAYTYLAACLGMDGTADSNTYSIAGTFDGARKYTIGGQVYYQSALQTFPQKYLYASDPDTTRVLSWKSGSITDWGYYFNTIIRDYVGLDRYGATNPLLKSIVDAPGSMDASEIQYVLDNSRGVAFRPKSPDGAVTTVPEFQGYTNYALLRFGDASNTYKYTNNTYTNRETTNISQVNKGQITTYPYNVNTAAFAGSDSTVTAYGGSYMKIGKTHEQYFQINMNADDIVVWYCMSNYSSISGGVISYDTSSYYDDVPNDCVNAYYIYNKGNVTYSGVGHSSNASLYTGASIGQEYINEAKLFVNTMIAAYQSAPQDPTVSIKQDARGTGDLKEKYLLVDIGNSKVLEKELGPTDESRAVYYRVTDPSVGANKTISVAYYVADPGGTAVGTIPEKVNPLKQSAGSTLDLVTYNADGTAAAAIKGGYVYKFYLPDDNCLNRLVDDNAAAVTVYVKVTTTIGSSVKEAWDTIVIKNHQLYALS